MTDIATEDQAAVVRRLSAEIDRLSMWGPNDLRKLADLEAENEQLRERVATLQASSGYEACIAQLEIERLRAIPQKLTDAFFAVAHTDMVGDEEERTGYLKALRDVKRAMALDE